MQAERVRADGGVFFLDGGKGVAVREATGADVEGLGFLYAALSDHDRYLRFFSAFDPDRPFLEHIATSAERGGLALVAVAATPTADAGRIVGEAELNLLPNGDGELGIVVHPEWRGIGGHLLDALRTTAHTRGIPNLEADILTSNAPMLALARARGYATLPESDWSVVRILIGSSGAMPTWPDSPRRPRVLVETPGGRWSHRTPATSQAQVVACAGPTRAGRRCPAIIGEPCPLAAGADVIVLSRPLDDEQWRALPGAHALLHPGATVCLEQRR